MLRVGTLLSFVPLLPERVKFLCQYLLPTFMNKRNKTTNTTCYFFGADHTPINRWAPSMELWEEETNSSPASMPLAVLGERVWTRPSEAPTRQTEIGKQP